MIVYKIFETYSDHNGLVFPRTLFHGIPVDHDQSRAGRSRVLPLDRWLDAEVRQVRDGAGNAQYLSGFHCYPDLDAVKAWFKTASTENRVVARVEIGSNYRHKNRAIRPTLLASEMIIHCAHWVDRLVAETMMAQER